MVTTGAKSTELLEDILILFDLRQVYTHTDRLGSRYFQSDWSSALVSS